jgi:thiamine pyrophosphate-dependent acetolactate synthase large subunit-like protein
MADNILINIETFYAILSPTRGITCELTSHTALLVLVVEIRTPGSWIFSWSVGRSGLAVGSLA